MQIKRRISGKDVLGDLRSGCTDSALMEKYRLSSSALQTIFHKLVVRQAIDHSELYDKSPLYRERVDQINARSSPRASLTVRLPIYDLQAATGGVLRDISETGLRVAGIETHVGELKTFQIPIDIFMPADPLMVIAECKWIQTRGRNSHYLVSGFEIRDLSEPDRKSLQKFIKLLLLSKSGEWQILP
ncbi:MAG: PilZ domain-containing protein [Desulfomonilaceae bacterium]